MRKDDLRKYFIHLNFVTGFAYLYQCFNTEGEEWKIVIPAINFKEE